MKTTTMKNALVMASLFLATGYLDVASAHEQNGSLGDATTASDLYGVNCYDDNNGPPAKLVYSVSDLPPEKAPLIAISVRKGKGTAWTTVVDRVDGDGNYSPDGVVAKGSGVYQMVIRKVSRNKAGSELYNAEFHCLTASNVHTGTSWYILRNQ